VRHAVTLLGGDGLGPELAAATRRVLDATGVDFEWTPIDAGAGALEAAGASISEPALEAVRAAGTCLKAPVAAPAERGPMALDRRLHGALGLFVSARFCKGRTRDGRAVDLVLFRDEAEGLGAGLELGRGEPRAARLIETLDELTGVRLDADSGIGIRPISRSGVERSVEVAFEYAKRHGRSKLTAVHRAGALRHTDGLFLHTVRNVAVRFPEVPFEDGPLDEVAAGLALEPERYDVLVTPDLYGRVLGQVVAAQIGAAPIATWGADGAAVFEAGPCARADLERAMLGAGVLLLRHVGEDAAAERVDAALTAAGGCEGGEWMDAVLAGL
jgi:isocitrate dehydrogenase (NAD+)